MQNDIFNKALGDYNKIADMQGEDLLCRAICSLLDRKPLAFLTDVAHKDIKTIAIQTSPYCSMENGVLVYYNKLSSGDLSPKVVAPKAYQQEIIKAAHCSRFAGHCGPNKTLFRVLDKFWWPHMAQQISQFCAECLTCQMSKNPYASKPPLMPLPIADSPNVRVHADLFGPLLPSAQGNKYILVMTDAFSKFVQLVALPNKEAETVAKAIFHKWICLFSPMKILLTDNGKEFANKLDQQLCAMLDIQHKFTSSLHPQTNASAETFNKWILNYMRAGYIGTNDDWENLLPCLTIAYNSAVHDTTQRSPFFLTFGQQPRSLIFPTVLPETTISQWPLEQRENLKKAHDLVRKNINISRELMTNAQKNINPKVFQLNEIVLIYYPKTSFTGKGLQAKFVCNWIPAVITEVISMVAYRAKLINKKSPPFVVHAERIKPCFPRKFWVDPTTTPTTKVKSTTQVKDNIAQSRNCLLYTSPSPRDQRGSRMPSSA